MAKTRTVKAAKRGRPDPLMAAAARERARHKRMIAAKRDIARLTNELRRAHLRAYDVTQAWATELLEGRGYEVRPRVAGGDTQGESGD
jgi:hypothetical protein